MAPELARAVTFTPNEVEPRHRWLRYRQGFARALVDRFREIARPGRGPILDPFSGTGTVPLAVAQRGGHGLGVEALPVLAFLARSKGATTPPPPLPDLPDARTFEDWARRLEHPLHRAALLAAAAFTVTGLGRRREKTPPPTELLLSSLAAISDDVSTPCPGRIDLVAGDARRLPLADGIAPGIVTSPPYLARYDYERNLAPLTRLFSIWHPSRTGRRGLAATQVRAHRGAGRRDWSAQPHPAAAEATERLREAGQAKLAGIVRSYFEDLDLALAEMARVLAPGAPAWIVIGGSHLERVYVPADLILAEMATEAGFRVERLAVARELSDQARRLGSLGPMATRETIVALRKPRV